MENPNDRQFQKNRSPQGNVLSPMLFNIYIYIQGKYKHFICFNDLAIAVQDEKVESKLSDSFNKLRDYHQNNYLPPNPMKTEACTLHLKNREAKQK